jgi:uncharacterized iron-regulated membrane protein
MNFHEKSAWACFGSIVLVYSPYLWFVYQQPMSYLGLFPLAVVESCVVLAGFHIVNALVTRSIRNSGKTPPVDELDRLIELRAAKFSGFVMAFVVMGWCLLTMYWFPVLGVRATAIANQAGGAAPPLPLAVPMNEAVLAIHGLFAGFLLANLAYYGSIVFGYRRLANG